MFAICHQFTRSSASTQYTRCLIGDRTGLLSLSDKRSFHPTFPQKGCESKAFLISLPHATPPRGINLIEAQYIQNHLCPIIRDTLSIVEIFCPHFRKHISEIMHATYTQKLIQNFLPCPKKDHPQTTIYTIYLVCNILFLSQNGQSFR